MILERKIACIQKSCVPRARKRERERERYLHARTRTKHARTHTRGEGWKQAERPRTVSGCSSSTEAVFNSLHCLKAYIQNCSQRGKDTVVVGVHAECVAYRMFETPLSCGKCACFWFSPTDGKIFLAVMPLYGAIISWCAPCRARGTSTTDARHMKLGL